MAYNTIYSTKEFIEISNQVHDGFYQYDKSKYIQCDKKVVITCPIHGDFKQAPTRHMAGNGCMKCGRMKTRAAQKERAKKEFESKGSVVISEILSSHPELFAISETKYMGAQSAISFACHKHGIISKRPAAFIKSGCQLCKREEKLTAKVIERLSSLFKTGYDFRRVKVSIDSNYVDIVCEIHGDVKFNYKSLSRSDRPIYCCPECGRSNSGNQYSTGDFIGKAKSVHGDKYDYSFVRYVSSSDKVIVRCKKHGFFSQKARSHLEGREGCLECLMDLYEDWSKRPIEDRLKRKKHKVSKDKKRAEKYGAVYEPINRRKVFERDKFRCQVCGVKTQKRNVFADNAAELGHIVPLSKGGSHTYANVQCECKKCNALKHDKITDQQLTIFSKVNL